MTFEVAATSLKHQLPALADEWRARCASHEDGPLPVGAARSVLAAIVYSLDGDAVLLPAYVEPLFAPDEETVTPRQLAVLRALLNRTVAVAVPGRLAIAALDRIDHFVDELVERSVTRTVQALEQAAYLDPLTGVGNRRALHRQIRREVSAAVRHGRPVSVVSIDLDGLKRINDELGHPAGDATLRRLAEVLTRELRAADSIFRVGGDEFVLLLPDTPPELVDTLLARTQVDAPSFSYGSAAAPNDGHLPDAVLRLSDQRLLEGRRERAAAAPRWLHPLRFVGTSYPAVLPRLRSLTDRTLSELRSPRHRAQISRWTARILP
jgi:diguanylate cyclase (GGDEF)-like protein